MATYSYLIDKKDAIDDNYDVDKFINENIIEMINDWIYNGDDQVKISIEIPIRYDEEYNEYYNEDVKTITYNIKELISQYMDKDELVDLIDSLVIDLNKVTA